ncbi:MAG: hypothetical protein IT477_10990 [Rhodanobacteraceae bacterium]|nr:hypothetical protein [Rhodanobacteraceae bacterium]
MHRVCGEVLCEDCGLPYRKHPYDPDHLSGIDGQPFLHRACDGRLLKL